MFVVISFSKKIIVISKTLLLFRFNESPQKELVNVTSDTLAYTMTIVGDSQLGTPVATAVRNGFRLPSVQIHTLI